MLITFKNTFTATSRLVFDEMLGHHSLAKLTNKINHHRGHRPCTSGEIELTPWTKLEVEEIFVCSSQTWLGSNCQSLLLVEESAMKNQSPQTAVLAAVWPDLSLHTHTERQT